MTAKQDDGKTARSEAHAIRMMMDAKSRSSAEELIDELLRQALSGDMLALKLLINRIWPGRRGAVVRFAYPKIRRSEDIGPAINSLGQQAADGVLTPDEARLLLCLVEARARVFEAAQTTAEIAELRERIDVLAAAAGLASPSHVPN